MNCNLTERCEISSPCSSRGSSAVDVLGIVAAGVCLAHCLALPVILSLVPSLALCFGDHDLTHILLAGWVILFCTLAILPGFRQHGYKRILILASVGLIAVLAATFHGPMGLSEVIEVPLITVGNLMIIGAHFWNRRVLSVSQ